MHANTLFKLTASGLAFATIGCSPFAANTRLGNLVTPAADTVKGEAKLFAESRAAVQADNHADALILTERLVELAPRDAGYRTQLGDLYLKHGRFASAEAAFADVLRLDPSNSRAALSLSLAMIAQGKSMLATVELDRLGSHAAPGDLGLAYALAGRTDRALELLEPAARGLGADGRVRQNLALTYALVGDWGKARAIAAQDVHPGELADRLQSWADFANPAHADSRVARLLGVQPGVDPGLPVQLALRDEMPELAVVEPVAPTPEILPSAKPIDVAGYAAAGEAPVDARLAAAAESLVKAEPVVIKQAIRIADAPIPAFTPRKSAKLDAVPKSGAGRFVVQIGAYGSPAVAQAAWGRAVRRFQLAGAQPHSTKVTLPGKGTFTRLSIAGFESPAEAGRLCRSIRAKGGACFVRTRAGDTLAAWAGTTAGRG